MGTDDRGALGARAYHVARTPDLRARARAIVALVRSYVASHSRFEPVGDDERTDPDVCRYCGRPVRRVMMRSGRVLICDPRPRRMCVLEDDPCGYVATCYVIHFDTCKSRPADRLRYEPQSS